MTTKDRRYLYFVVFISGMTTLGIELSASRLLGNVFGTSNIVWASIIGLILIYLTVGYFIGGRWADRWPNLKVMYTLLSWGALTIGLIPVIAQPILRLAASAFDELVLGILVGSFATVLILFIIPVTLLGMITPFAIRLAVDDRQKTGSISGQIYAISTLGSFIGTFLPVLVLIPIIGTTRTFYFFSLLLLIVAFIGLWQVSGWRGLLPLLWMFLLVGVLVLWKGYGQIKLTSGQIFETESAYNYIQVIEQNGYRYLRLNEGQGIHSIWHPTQIAFNGPWEQFLVAPFFNSLEGIGYYLPERVTSMAVIGLAAGTVARQATAVYGEIPIDGFEIDPKIIQIGRIYFDMNEPNINAIAQDGRWGLAHSKRHYTLIVIDAYRAPYIPWHLTTREFFQIVYNHLEEDGVIAINVGRAPGDRRLIEYMVGTLQTVFPSVYVMDVPDTFNSIIYATVKPTKVSNFYNNLLLLMIRKDVHPLLIEAMQRYITNQKPTPDSTLVFTDDLSPIEWITNSLVLKFVLMGDKEF